MKAVYEEIIDFIAAGTTAQDWQTFRASDATRERVELLLAASRSGTATTEELEELDHYLDLEHIVRLAKARAKSH